MADDISPRAQAILDEIEREAGARIPRAPAPLPADRPTTPRSPSSGPPRTGLPPRPPHVEPTSPADGGIAATAYGNGELGRLVSEVVAQAERARLRLSALSEAIADIESRLGPSPPDVAPLPTSGEQRDPAPLPPPLDPEPGPVETPPTAGPQGTVEEQLRVLEALLAGPGAPNAAAPARRAAPAPPPPPAAPSPAYVAPTAPVEVDDSARLVALEMAAAGLTRDEVGERLQALYGVADPETLLDVIFGAGTPGSSRVDL